MMVWSLEFYRKASDHVLAAQKEVSAQDEVWAQDEIAVQLIVGVVAEVLAEAQLEVPKSGQIRKNQ